MPEKVDKNLILTEYIKKLHDAQGPAHTGRPTELDGISEKLANSAKEFNSQLYVLTDEVEEEMVDENRHYIPIAEDLGRYKLPMYFLRWELAFKFIVAHPEIEKVVLMDLPDTMVLKDAFDDIEDGYLYIADEYNNLDTQIIRYDRHPRYMNDLFYEHPGWQLLNCGVVAGTRDVIIEFLAIYTKLLTQSQVDVMREVKDMNMGSYEMNLINYVAYKYFRDRLVHGREVCTLFQYNETNSDAWFKHK